MIEIGDYKIEWVDQDHVLVTRNYYLGTSHTAKITGGDMETFLGGIFLGAEMTYKSGNVITKSTHETTFEDKEESS